MAIDLVKALRNEREASAYRSEFVATNLSLAAAQLLLATQRIADPQAETLMLQDRLELEQLAHGPVSNVEKVLTAEEKSLLPEFELAVGLIFDAAVIYVTQDKAAGGSNG